MRGTCINAIDMVLFEDIQYLMDLFGALALKIYPSVNKLDWN